MHSVFYGKSGVTRGSPTSGAQSSGRVGGRDGDRASPSGGGAHLQLLEQHRRGWGERRLDLVNGDRGAGAGGGPHPRTAPELALRWQGGGGGEDVLRKAKRQWESRRISRWRRRPCLAASCMSGPVSAPSSICAGQRLPVVDGQGAGRIYNMEGVWWLQTARRGRDPAAEDRRRRRPSMAALRPGGGCG
jgi:hypothetical protein